MSGAIGHAETGTRGCPFPARGVRLGKFPGTEPGALLHMKRTWIWGLLLLVAAGLAVRRLQPSGPRSSGGGGTKNGDSVAEVAPAARGTVAVMGAGAKGPRDDGEAAFWARLEDALGGADLDERQRMLRDLALDLAGADPVVARRILERLMKVRGREGQIQAVTFLEAFQDAFAARDAAAAAVWGEGLSGPWRQIALTPVARRWAGTDLSSALGWVEGLGPGGEALGLLRVMGQVVESAGNAETIRQWARHVASRTDGGKLAEAAGRIWGRVDAEGAVQWASGLTQPAEQGTALVAIAAGLAADNPRRAGEWVNRFPPGEYRERAATATANTWAGSDPAAAAAWVEGTGDARLLESTFHAIAQAWKIRDPAGAEAWISRVDVPATAKEYVRQF